MTKSNYSLPKLYDADNNIDKRWFVYYLYKNPETGKMQRFRIFISQKILTKTARYNKASEIIEKFSNKLLSGWNPFEENSYRNILLNDALNIVLNHKSCTLRKRSSHSYSSAINIFREFLFDNKLIDCKVSDFDYYMAIRFMDYLLIERKIANRTYNNYRMYMNAIFNVLIKRKYVNINPFKGIDKLNETQAPILSYTPSEIKLIADTLPSYNKKLYLAAMLIFYCFIRPQELVRLKLWQIDTVKKEIFLTGSDTKNKKQSIVAIPKQLIEILKDFNFIGNPSLYIFSKNLEIGKIQIAPTRIAEQWRAYTNSVGLPDWKGIYDLKNTGAGMCIDAGINVRDLQIHIRHSSLEVTQRYLEKFRNVTSRNLIDNFPKF